MGPENATGHSSPSHQHVFLGHLILALGAFRFSQEAKKENIHQRKMLETKCVPSEINSFYCHLKQKYLGRQSLIPASEGGAMPGNIVASNVGCQTGECSLLGIGNPQRTTEWEKEPPGHCSCPPFSPTRGKARAGFRSSTPEQPWRALGTVILLVPHSGSRGWCGRDGQLGIYGSLRPGAKRT